MCSRQHSMMSREVLNTHPGHYKSVLMGCTHTGDQGKEGEVARQGEALEVEEGRGK